MSRDFTVKASALGLVLLLTACAKINDAGMRLVASTAPAFAMIDNTLLTGTVTVFVDRTGTFNLSSGAVTGFQCAGNMRYTATRSGVISLQCSNGADVLMTFNAMGELGGYAAGKSATGTATLTFGMEAASAAPYLKLPAGKRIVTTAEGAARLE